MKTVLYFGSFNPPHNGHTAIARYVAESDFCRELWFVVSPRNPLKEDSALAVEEDRLQMVRIAAGEMLAGLPVEVCDVEFRMPRPSYTIDTMRELGRLYPDREFALLGGADILDNITRWKDYSELLAKYVFYIYPRGGSSPDVSVPGGVVVLDGAPVWDFSSTDVRRTLSDGGDISRMVCPGVADYIESHDLWKTKKQ